MKNLERLRTEYNIKVKPDEKLAFKELMLLKNRQQGFFFDFKKNRTTYLKAKEPTPPEPEYNKIIRQRDEERNRRLLRK